jgi:zinc protease
MRNRTTRTLLAVALMVPLQAVAQTPPPLKYETFTLDNGLKFIVHEDRSAPIVAVDVWYDVGSANEPAGRSGFAHLFEHMLFQETEALGKGEFMNLIQEAGGTLNGTTNTDRTMYYEVVPSNRVNLALWMEAERMGRLRVTDENFQREREVVKEERRMRIDNAPYMNGMLTLDTLHTDYRPYRHTVIGSMDDLDAATAEDVMEFHRMYYGPNNATITLSGDITLAQAKEFAQQYFADIPRGPDPPQLPEPAAAPRADGERRVTLEDRMAQVPMIMAGYTIPPHREDDTYALTLMSAILSRGQSSRLTQRLVREERAAVFAASFLDSRNMGGYLGFQAQPTPNTEIAKLEELLWAEVEKLRSDGVTEEELEKVKRQTIAGQIMGSRQTVLGKAEMLQHSRMLHGDLGAADRDLEEYEKVTTADIVRVARKYLTPENRTVVTIVPATRPAT